MNGLDTHARAVLNAARHADDPTHRQRERSARAMALRFGFGTAAFASSTSTWAGLAVAKVWIPAMLVMASGIGGAVWFESKRPPRVVGALMAAAATTSETAVRTERMATTAQIVNGKPAPPELPAQTIADLAVPTEGTAVQRASVKSARPKEAPPKEAPIATANHLQEETTLLAEVNSALGSGQLRGALDVLDTYDRRFPNGVLREESSATRVVALCQLEHGPRAASFAKRFLSQHASSPLIPRVQRACAGQIP